MNTETLPTPARWTPKQVMYATIFVVSVGLIFWLLYRFRAVILILFVAIMIGTAIRPAVDWLAKRGISRVVAEVLIFLFLLLVLVAFLLLAVPMILEQSSTLSSMMNQYYNGMVDWLMSSPSRLLRIVGLRLPAHIQADLLLEAPAPPAAPGAVPVDPATQTADQVAQFFRTFSTAARALFAIVAVLLTSFYWTLEGDRAIRSILLLFPMDRREASRELIESIQARLGGYLLGQGLLCLVIGILSLVAYLLIGLPNAMLLAVIAGLLEAVPAVGPILGAVPAIVIAASMDPTKVMWVIVAAGVIQVLENNLLVPRVMDRQVGINPLITILSLAALSSLMGIAGALIAIPIAAILQLFVDRFVLNPDEASQIKPEGRDYLSYLRLQAQEIAQDVRKQVRNKEDVVGKTTDQLEDEIEALANDLDRLLAQANQAGEVGGL